MTSRKKPNSSQPLPDLLPHLNDSQLLSQIQLLAAQERRLTMDLLLHLREVERRKLHLQKGYGSIYEYTVKELKYSEAAAARRVNAMRLFKEFTGVSESLETGALNLSSVSAVQSFIKKEEKESGKAYTLEQKKELLQAVENKSKRECEQILAQRLSSAGKTPQAQPASSSSLSKASETEIRVILTAQQKQKLEQVRSLLTYSDKGNSYAGLFELMADLLLEQISDPKAESQQGQKKIKKRVMNPQRKLRLRKKGKRIKPQLRLLA